MQRFIGLLVLLLAVSSPALGAPASAEEAELGGATGLKAFVTKTGGKIRVYREVTRNGTIKSTEKVEISIDQIQEVDDKCDALKPSTKISSFANVNFTVQSMTNVQLGNLSGVYADCLNCSGVLTGKVGGDTAISLAVCTIRNNGSLTTNGEVSNVTAGQLKITFTMTSWGTWTSANNKLAVDINIKIPPNRDVVNGSDTHGKPTKFSLGADAFMEFSRMAYQDSRWYTMPDGYPLYKSKGAAGANNVFRLIFDHFSNSTVYDPNVEVGYQLNDTGSTDTNVSSATVAFNSSDWNTASTVAFNSTDRNTVSTVAGSSTLTNAASTVAVSFFPLLAAALLHILAVVETAGKTF